MRNHMFNLAISPFHLQGYTASADEPSSAKSPKPDKKSLKVLAKQPNGSFMGAEQAEGDGSGVVGMNSPRTKRANKKSSSGGGGGGGGAAASEEVSTWRKAKCRPYTDCPDLITTVKNIRFPDAVFFDH